MTTLYIIGNGFDLWHKLPTDYHSFYAQAKESLDEMDAYYVSESHIEKQWHDFENCLGRYNWQLFYDEFNNIDSTFESFRPSDLYGLEDELVEQSRTHVEFIESLFQKWVLGIDVSVARPITAFKPDSKFLTFNYTDTLQKVYGISSKDILHIHGNAKNHNELIFGHGESREEESEIDENGDSNRTIFTDAENAAKHPFYAFQKPVDDLIKKNRDYFISLSCISQIIIIGHSLNDIDLPYYREIARNTPKSRWIVYCYGEFDFERHVRQLELCGVDAFFIETRAYESKSPE